MFNQDGINRGALAMNFRNNDNRSSFLKLPFLLQKGDRVGNGLAGFLVKFHLKGSHSARECELGTE